MKKICTSIEESKKLIELGIDIYTADMFWLVTREPHLHVLGNEPLSNYDRWEHYPAWSLIALLGLIQDDIKIEKTLFDQSNMFTYSIIGDAYEYRSYEHENLIDAAFEMVCWLLENQKI